MPTWEKDFFFVLFFWCLEDVLTGKIAEKNEEEENRCPSEIATANFGYLKGEKGGKVGI